MTNTEIEFDGCSDCLVWIANNDNSGMSDPDRFFAGLELNWPSEVWSLIAIGNEQGFSWRECEGCGALPGDRFSMLAVKRV